MIPYHMLCHTPSEIHYKVGCCIFITPHHKMPRGVILFFVGQCKHALFHHHGSKKSVGAREANTLVRLIVHIRRSYNKREHNGRLWKSDDRLAACFPHTVSRQRCRKWSVRKLSVSKILQALNGKLNRGLGLENIMQSTIVL